MSRLIDNDNPAKFLLDNFALTLEAKDTSEENTKYLQNIRIRINEAFSKATETYTALKLRLVKADTNEEILTGRISAKLCRSDVGFAAQCSYSLSFNEKKIDVVSPFFWQVVKFVIDAQPTTEYYLY